MPNVLLGPMPPDVFCFLGRDTGLSRNPLCWNPLSLVPRVPKQRTGLETPEKGPATRDRQSVSGQRLECRKRGCNKWGLKGCLAALPGNRPKSAFFALFLPFLPFCGGCEEHLGNPENGGKRPFSSAILGFP